MKKIILVRHSIAEDSSYVTPDIDRGLTKAGIIHAKNQSKWFVDANLVCDLLISSNAKRAIETATIFYDTIKYTQKIIVEPFLYEEFTTHDFIKFIQKQLNVHNTLVIVGHNPTISNMAYRFAPNFNTWVKPGTIIIMDFNIDNWNDIEVGKGCISCVK